MKYCLRCLYPENHPLNIIINEDGLCSGCIIHEEKDQIDWDIKEKKLINILNSYKNKSGNNYDCIIPVSGARDSYFIVHTIKKKYGLNPLLVTYNKQYNTDVGIRNLANLRTIFDCDLLTLTVNPQTVKKITKATIRKMGSIYWHCIAGQTVFPVQISVKFKIPLIIWGCHQGIDQVGMFSHNDEVEMTRKYRKEHDLMGFEAEDLVDIFDHVKEEDLLQFHYPSDSDIENVGVRGIYLNNYIRWDSKQQHEEMIKLYNYETFFQNKTIDTYNDIDCFHYSDLHDYIKYVKYGYGKITDHVSREIRFGRLTREDGINLVKHWTNRTNIFDHLFMNWLGIDNTALNFILDQHRSNSIWNHNMKTWKWELKDTIENHLFDKGVEKFRLVKKEKCEFIITNSKRPDYNDDKYVLIGKGIY